MLFYFVWEDGRRGNLLLKEMAVSSAAHFKIAVGSETPPRAVNDLRNCSSKV